MEPQKLMYKENPREFVKLIKKTPAYTVELPVKTEPYEHQKRGYLIATTIPNCGLFFDPGLGKTLVSIATIGRRASHKQIYRVLIVAPLSVLAVWEEQFEEHAFFSIDYSLYVLDGRRIDDRIELVEYLTKVRKKNKTETAKDHLEIIVTNYEALFKMEGALTKWGPDMIVADESQMIKNRKAKRTKMMWRLGKSASYKLILTGTPVTESPLDFWAQYKFLDQNVFGKRYKDFESQYAVMGGYGKFQVKRYRNLKQLSRIAYSIGYRVAKEDAIDLPPVIELERYCYLEPTAQKLHEEMERDRLIKFLGGDDASAPIVLTALLRMQQITGGFLKREDGSYAETGREKLDLLKEVLREIPKEEKVVIFARFTPEIKAIKEVVRKVGRSVEELSGKVRTDARKDLRKRFQTQADPNTLVVQVATGGVGIDLFAASTAIFYSHDPSFGKTMQAKGRLDRIGQKGEKVQFIHLLARNTIDETIYRALKEKRDLFELVMDKYLKKEERLVSKKHTKKRKVERKRVAPTELEDQEMIERLKNLKNQVEEEGGVEEVAPKRKRTKAEVEDVQTEDANLVTVKDLADELGISPVSLRKKLRNMDIEKPSGRWEWPEDHPDLDVIRGTEEEEEAPAPKKAKKAKKVKPEPEPEPEEEEDEFDEEDELEDEWDEIDYEEMSKKELKELCREREIKKVSKATPEQMIEALIEWDNEQFEDEE